LVNLPVVAVVDDDLAIREALADLIKSLGHSGVVFASAEEFLAYERRSTVDCMVVDVKMPGISGIELQSRLRREPDCPPIIFMTSHSDDRIRKTALDAGAIAFLGKPVDLDKLIQCIGEVLAK
jgi:FixJ family two-component response regulator